MKNPMKFIQEVKQEAFKVSWPTGKETLQGALMVFAMAVVMSLFFLLLDQVLKFFLELMKAVDEHIPQPARDVDKPFLMPVEDVFSISGRGTVATGRIESGVIKTGEEVEIVGIKETKKSVCTGVEMFRKLLDSGEAGDNVGILLRGIERSDIERGQVLCKPGSITPHTKLKLKRMYLKKMRVEDTLLSLLSTDHSFILEQQTLQEK